MKYLVTGGAGFIGSNIVKRLLELGQDVTVLDNFATGKRENLLKLMYNLECIIYNEKKDNSNTDLTDKTDERRSVNGERGTVKDDVRCTMYDVGSKEKEKEPLRTLKPLKENRNTDLTDKTDGRRSVNGEQGTVNGESEGLRAKSQGQGAESREQRAESEGLRAKGVGQRGKLDVIEGDLRSFHIVRSAVKGVDYILHQGALPSVPRSINDPITSNDVNILGTLNILEAAKEFEVKRVVLASSSSIYGNSENLPKVETMPVNPMSPYALTKYTQERYCQVFYDLYGLETVALRYFNVFGPNQDPTSQYSAVIPKFITKMMNDERPVIYGDGSQSRDFTYVENNVEANLLACTAENVAGEVINIACGERYTLIELVEMINKILGKNIEPIFEKDRAGDVKHSLADIEKAKRLLGYEVKVGFEEGLRNAARRRFASM